MSTDREKSFHSWTKLLNPEELRWNLIVASIYLTAYELLKQAMIEPLRGFFSSGFDANGPIVGARYRKKVLSLHKMPFFASAIWFHNAGALADDDLDRIREIRDHRNFVAHNIPRVISETDSFVRSDLLVAIAETAENLHKKLAQRWERCTKAPPELIAVFSIRVVGPVGLEPTTLGLKGRYSTN